ncbi:hypothetical protein [uncultured Legionella sp.]|uniref:hypothetical protein n=1 Tax=uncultured Legionella sp. TaxID=210934 RepID=UPI00260F01FD|nr:hypothetical protein [uncultured Legionella sp.]
MKEIHPPYNDWWEPIRQLDFDGRKLNESLFDMVEHLLPPARLAESVILGMNKLEDSKSIHNATSLQERLRPLFCPVEINLASDMEPNEAKENDIKIPVEFFINKKLTDNHIAFIAITRSAYEHALTLTGSHFPETLLPDADHAWLTPIKAVSDQRAIEHLIKIGLIDDKFAYDVLSVDMTNPIFSNARCGLLKYVPNTWANDWKNKFIQGVKSSHDAIALELVNQLTNAARTPEYHRQNEMNFLRNCVEQLKSEEQVKKLFLLLMQRREEIKASELSKNRRGQILEPGFRVIFPEIKIKPVPGQLVLTDTCEVKESAQISKFR